MPMEFGSREHLRALRQMEKSAGQLHTFTLLWDDGSVSFAEVRGTKKQAFAKLRQKLPRQVVRRGRPTSILYNGAQLSSEDRALLTKIRP